MHKHERFRTFWYVFERFDKWSVPSRYNCTIKAFRRFQVIDLICFKPESALQLVKSPFRQISHYMHCGTIWVRGHKVEVPSKESDIRRPISEYGVLKAEIECYLLQDVNQIAFPTIILHPGHIVGPGWVSI